MTELKHTRLGLRGERWSNARGTLDIRMPTADIVTRRFEGHATIDFVEPACKHLEALFAAGVAPLVFDDFELGVGYDSDVRMKLTAWLLRHMTAIKELHVLVRPGLLAMGVSVANLAMGGGLITYSDRSAFEWAYAAAMAERLTAGSAPPARTPPPR
jgi:hypothetical protein